MTASMAETEAFVLLLIDVVILITLLPIRVLSSPLLAAAIEMEVELGIADPSLMNEGPDFGKALVASPKSKSDTESGSAVLMMLTAWFEADLLWRAIGVVNETFCVCDICELSVDVLLADSSLSSSIVGSTTTWPSPCSLTAS